MSAMIEMALPFMMQSLADADTQAQIANLLAEQFKAAHVCGMEIELPADLRTLPNVFDVVDISDGLMRILRHVCGQFDIDVLIESDGPWTFRPIASALPASSARP